MVGLATVHICRLLLSCTTVRRSGSRGLYLRFSWLGSNAECGEPQPETLPCFTHCRSISLHICRSAIPETKYPTNGDRSAATPEKPSRKVAAAAAEMNRRFAQSAHTSSVCMISRQQAFTGALQRESRAFLTRRDPWRFPGRWLSCLRRRSTAYSLRKK